MFNRDEILEMVMAAGVQTRSIRYLTCMDRFSNVLGVPYKHLGRLAERASDKIKEHARQFAEKHQLPFHYLSSSLSKEDYAPTIMEQYGIHRSLTDPTDDGWWMVDGLERRNWAHLLNVLARRFSAWLDHRNGLEIRGYYRSIRESEYAMDEFLGRDRWAPCETARIVYTKAFRQPCRLPVKAVP